MDALVLDGNAVAGLLQEVFAAEMTTSIGTCNGCGTTGPLGAAHVFRGAGVVLRCPHCSTALLVIAQSAARTWIAAPGMRTLELRDLEPARVR